MKIFILGCVALCLATLNIFAQTTRKDVKGNVEVIGRNGELLEYHLLDSRGNFRLTNQLAKIVYGYDSMNNLVLERFYQGNGKLYEYPSGVAMRKYIWNAAQDVLIIQNYDSLEEKTIDKNVGSSMVCYKYDSLKRLKELIYFSSDSLRTNNNRGHSKAQFCYRYPFVVEKYYDENDNLIKIIDESSEYLISLQLSTNSIPKWLRRAQQFNRVDGVKCKSFQYDLILYDQLFDGMVELLIALDEGEVKTNELSKNLNVDKKVERKAIRAIKKAIFVSLSNSKNRPIEGKVNIYFKIDSRPEKRTIEIN